MDVWNKQLTLCSGNHSWRLPQIVFVAAHTHVSASLGWVNCGDIVAALSDVDECLTCRSFTVPYYFRKCILAVLGDELWAGVGI